MVRFVCPCGRYFDRKDHAQKHLTLKHACKARKIDSALCIDDFERITAAEKRQEDNLRVAANPLVIHQHNQYIININSDLIPHGSQMELQYIIDHAAEFVPQIFTALDDSIGAHFARTVWFNTQHPRLYNVFMISKVTQAIRIFRLNVHGVAELADMNFMTGMKHIIETVQKHMSAVCEHIDPVRHIEVNLKPTIKYVPVDTNETFDWDTGTCEEFVAYMARKDRCEDHLAVSFILHRDPLITTSLQNFTRPALLRQEYEGTLQSLIDKSDHGIGVILLHDVFKTQKAGICKKTIQATSNTLT